MHPNFCTIAFLVKCSVKYFGKNLAPITPNIKTDIVWNPHEILAKAIGILKFAKFTNKQAIRFITSFVIFNEKYLFPLFFIALKKVVL